MATITAFHVGDFAAQINNPNLAPETFNAALPTPKQAYSVSPVLAGEIDRLALEPAARQIQAFQVPTFEADWYHRVHLIPRSISMGNVVSTQIREAFIWNAHYDERPLSSVTAMGDEGLTLDAPFDVPHTMRPSEWHVLQLSAASEGPPEINASYTFVFPGEAPVLLVTGRRIEAWLSAPDWSRGVTETLTWLTDPLRSPTGVEQRRALRLSPRRRLAARFLLEGRSRTRFDLSLRDLGGRLWAVPIWYDAQRLMAPLSAGALAIDCDTRWRDFRVGGQALLAADDEVTTFEVVEIASIAEDLLGLARPTHAAWPRGTRLYPVRAGQLPEQPRVRRLTDRAVEVTAAFDLREPADWPAVPPDSTYKGYPVYATPPDESETLTGTFERLMAWLDNETGPVHSLDTADIGFPVAAHRRILSGRAERSDYRSLLHYLRGRQVPVWVPTHSADLELAVTAIAAATALTVVNAGYARYGLGRTGSRDIRVELWEGSAFHRQVVDASEIDIEHELIEIDSAIGITVEPGHVRRISFMSLCVLDHDATEILHLTDGEGVATSALRWRSIRDDV